MRNLTQDMVTTIDGRQLRPVVFVRLDIDSDPVGFWSGFGTASTTGSTDEVFNDTTFFSVPDLFGVSDVTEDNEIGGAVTVSLRADDLDEVAMRQFVRDRRQWRGRNGYVWLGYVEVDTGNVIEWPIRMKTGVMTNVNIVRSTATTALEVSIDSDLRNSEVGGYRIVNHGNLFPDDTFTAFMVELANKPQGFVRGSQSGKDGSTEQLDRDESRNRMK